MRTNRNTFTVIAVSLLVLLINGYANPASAASHPVNETESAAEISDENDRLYDEVWNLISDNFLYRDRLKNWNSWRHKFDGHMKTKASSNTAINTMLDSLSDEYTFFRDQSATEERKILRQKTKVVEHKMLDGQVGYIHISTFNSVFCVPETARALIELNQANGIILDLRDNCGGSINSTFDVFSLLTKAGKFVTMKGTADHVDSFEEMTLCDNSALSTADGVTLRKERINNLSGQKPLVVLVDQNTKSAAEMLAGALRDNGRATVVGSRTFGKGIVQRVWEFPNNTSIKISSAKYYLPGGTNIHKIGLVPDLSVDTTLVPKIKTGNRGPRKNQPQIAASGNGPADRPIETEQIAHDGQLSGDSDTASTANRDAMLTEARTVLKRKLVSLAKP